MRRPLDRYLCIPMFGATLLFMVCLAVLLHLGEEDLSQGRAVTWAMWGMALLYPLFVIEAVAHWVSGSRFWKQNILYCLAPPLRLGARDHLTGRHLWLPMWGWSEVGRSLSERLERKLNIPMIVIALAVLPLMTAEHFLAAHAASQAEHTHASEEVAANSKTAASQNLIHDEKWELLLQLGTGLVWLAFAVEFIVMVSVAEKKARYCKEHWIDVVVIMIPFIAFLRAARLTRLLRLQQLAKTVRVYRLRGLMLRVYRGLILLDVMDRLIRGTPETRLAKLKEQLVDKERDLAELRAEIAALESDLHPPSLLISNSVQSRAA